MSFLNTPSPPAITIRWSAPRCASRRPYPDDQIDMVFFHPALALSSGRAIRQLSDVPFDGKTYQQWSRHRTQQNPWRADLDNVGTHLLLVKDWLAAGVELTMQTFLRMTKADHGLLERHLFPGDANEAVALALCGRRRNKSCARAVVVQKIVPIPYDQCSVRLPGPRDSGRQKSLMPLLHLAARSTTSPS